MTLTIRKRHWKRWAILALVLLLGYGSYRLIRPDPNLKKIEKLRQEFASADSKNWSSEERQQKGREMRDAMASLSTSQRDAMFAQQQKAMEENLRKYAQMSAKDKTRYLDERIDEMEKARQRFASTQANGQRPSGSANGFGAGPGGRGSGGASRSQEDRDKRRREMLNRTTPEFRSLMDQFRKDMDARRQQRNSGTRR